MGLINKVGGICYVVGRVEGVKVDKTLKFNKKAFTVAYFCFTSDFFSLFYSYYFFNISFIERQYFFFSTKIASSQSKILLYLYMVIKKILRYLHFC